MRYTSVGICQQQLWTLQKGFFVSSATPLKKEDANEETPGVRYNLMPFRRDVQGSLAHGRSVLGPPRKGADLGNGDELHSHVGPGKIVSSTDGHEGR